MQAARPDIFGALVYAECKSSNLVERFFGELQLDAFGLEQGRVLLDQ
jgi:hypothetical protein